MTKKTIAVLLSLMSLVIGICFVIFYFFFKKETAKASNPLTGNSATSTTSNDGLVSDLKTLLNNKITEVNTEIQRITNNVSDIGSHVTEITNDVTTIKDTVTNISTIRQGVMSIYKRFDLTPNQSQLMLTDIDPTKILDIERNGLTMDSNTEYTIDEHILTLRDEAEESETIIIEYFN